MFPSEYCHTFCTGKLEWCDYPDAKKVLRIYVTVLAEYRRVTDERTDRHLQRHSLCGQGHVTHRKVKSRTQRCRNPFSAVTLWNTVQVTDHNVLIPGADACCALHCRVSYYERSYQRIRNLNLT